MPDQDSDLFDPVQQEKYAKLRILGAFDDNPVMAEKAQKLIKLGVLRDLSGGTPVPVPIPQSRFTDSYAPPPPLPGMGDVKRVEANDNAETARVARINAGRKKSGLPLYNPNDPSTNNPTSFMDSSPLQGKAPQQVADDLALSGVRFLDPTIDMAAYPAAIAAERAHPDDQLANLIKTWLPDSTGGALTRSAQARALPTAAGIASFPAGAAIGSSLGEKIPGSLPVKAVGKAAGALVGGLGATMLGAGAVSGLQEEALKAALGPDAYQALIAQRAKDEQDHKIATMIGGILPTLATAAPNMEAITALPTLMKTAGQQGIRAGLASEAGKAVLRGMGESGANAASQALVEGARNLFQPGYKTDPLDFGLNLLTGAILPRVNKGATPLVNAGEATSNAATRFAQSVQGRLAGRNLAIYNAPLPPPGSVPHDAAGQLLGALGVPLSPEVTTRLLSDPQFAGQVIRQAQAAVHPDVGGDATTFKAVTKAGAALKGYFADAGITTPTTPAEAGSALVDLLSNRQVKTQVVPTPQPKTAPVPEVPTVAPAEVSVSQEASPVKTPESAIPPQSAPVTTPPLPAPVVPAKENLSDIGKGGGAIVDNMYQMLWDKVQKGDTTEGGGPSALLQVAQKVKSAGGLASIDDFKALAGEVQAVRDKGIGGKDYQDGLRAIVQKYSPAPENKSSEEGTIPPTDATTTGGAISAPTSPYTMETEAAKNPPPDMMSHIPPYPTPDKPLYDMTRDEIDSWHQKAKDWEKNLDTAVLGEEGAKHYRSLQAISNSTFADRDKQRAADTEIDQIENALPEHMRDALHGIGIIPDDAPVLDDYKEHSRNLSYVDGENESELGQSVANALIDIGRTETTDPSQMNSREQLAYARLRHALRYAVASGFDTQKVTTEGLKAAVRVLDPTGEHPHTVEEMLGPLISRLMPKKQEVKNEPKQISDSVPQPTPKPPETPVSVQESAPTAVDPYANTPKNKPTAPLSFPLYGLTKKEITEQYHLPSDYYTEGDKAMVISSKYRTPAFDRALEAHQRTVSQTKEARFLRPTREALEIEQRKVEDAARASMQKTDIPPDVAAFRDKFLTGSPKRKYAEALVENHVNGTPIPIDATGTMPPKVVEGMQNTFNGLESVKGKAQKEETAPVTTAPEVSTPVSPESPRTAAIGAVSGRHVETLEKAGYEFFHGPMTKAEKNNAVGPVTGQIIDRLAAANIGVRKVKMATADDATNNSGTAVETIVAPNKLSDRERQLIDIYIEGARKIAKGADPQDLEGFSRIGGAKYSAEATDALHLPNPRIKIGDGWYTNRGGEGVIYHEIGHALADKIGEGSPELHQFFQTAKKVADAPGLTDSGKWQISSTDTPIEYVSQLYSLTMQHPDDVAKYFPDEYQWIQQKADEIGFPISKATLSTVQTHTENTPSIPPKVRPHMALAGTVQTEIEKALAGDRKPLSNRELVQLANTAFGGTITEGKYTMRDVYDAVEVAINQLVTKVPGVEGGNYSRVLLRLNQILDAVPVMDARTEDQVQMQQFSTVPTEGYVSYLALGNIKGLSALEPSAGTGSLANFLRIGGANVTTNEHDVPQADVRAGLLEAQGFEITRRDAERLDAYAKPGETYDIVLMNPPFSATGGRVKSNKTAFGASHVESALELLKPGGRLVAIVGHGMSHDAPAHAKWFEAMEKEGYSLRANLLVDGSVYKKYGTEYSNRILVFDKEPLPENRYTDATLYSPHVDTGSRYDIAPGHALALPDVADLLRKLGNERQSITPVPATQPGSGLGTTATSGIRGAEQPESVSPDKSPAREPASTGLGGGGSSLVPGAAGGGRQSGNQSGERTRTQRDEPRNNGGNREDGTRPNDLGKDESEGGDAVPDAIPVRSADDDVKPLDIGRQEDNSEDNDAFVVYQPEVRFGNDHPATLVETSSMGGVSTPLSRMTKEQIGKLLHIPANLINNLSDAQIQSVLLAQMRHNMTNTAGEALGFFVGDGTGVGKGRIGAGIIVNNWHQGNRRILFVSADDTKLFAAASRDLGNVGGWTKAPNAEGKGGETAIPIRQLADFPASKGIDAGDGVIVTSYAKFRRPDRQTQLRAWLGEKTPVILFDESHFAANAAPGEEGQEGSDQGKAVIDIQDKLKSARIVYLSATGADKIDNLAPMSRLGLWGTGTPYLNFPQFSSFVFARGLAGMEMLAREMKATGAYLSRTIAFKDPNGTPIEYDELNVQVNPEQQEIYDKAAKAWSFVINNLDKAIKDKNLNRQEVRVFRAQFYGMQQRFFKNLMTSFKGPSIIDSIEKGIAAGMAPVVTIDSTNEGAMNAKVADNPNLDIDNIDFTPKDTLRNFVEQYWPTQLYQEVTDQLTQKTSFVPVWTVNGRREYGLSRPKDGEPVVDPRRVKMRDAILGDIDDVNVPNNLLNQLVLHFGVDNIAEISGRSSQLTMNKEGKLEIRRRKKPARGGYSDVNEYEQNEFNQGRRKIAIVTRAGAQGIDLHAGNKFANKKQRLHIIAELGWQTKNELQKLGRTHRSDEASAPRYVLASINISGDKRFASALAASMSAAGAISRGDRSAAGAGKLAEYNFNSAYGFSAIDSAFKQITPEDLSTMGIDLDKLDQKPPIERLKYFFNRLMLLPVSKQNEYYRHFETVLKGQIENAKMMGTYRDAIEVLPALSVKQNQVSVVYTDKQSGAQTLYYDIERELPNSLQTWRDVSHNKPEGSRLMRDKNGKPVFVVPIDKKDPITGQPQRFYRVTEPNGKERVRDVIDPNVYSLVGKDDDKETIWNEALQKVAKTRWEKTPIITGLTFPIANRIYGDTKAVRVKLPTGERVVGLLLDQASLRRTLRDLGVDSSVSANDPEALYHGALSMGDRDKILLAGGLELKKGNAYGSDAVQVTLSDGLPIRDPAIQRELKGYGVREINIGGWDKRFYLPSEDKAGPEAMAAILKQHPVIELPSVLKKAPVKPSSDTGIELHAFNLPHMLDLLFNRTTVGQPRTVKKGISFWHNFKNTIIEGMSNLKEVSPEANVLGSRLANSMSEARTLVGGTALLIDKATVKGYFPHFMATLMDDRLKAISESFAQMAVNARAVKPKDVPAAYTKDYEAIITKLGQPGLTTKINNALAKGRNLRARNAIVAALNRAARNTTRYLTDAELSAGLADPKFAKALPIYKEHIEKPLAQSHAANQGRFTTILGQSKTYIPLVGVDGDGNLLRRGGGKNAPPLIDPGNPRNRMATGQNKYTSYGEEFVSGVARSLRTNNRAFFITALKNANLLQPIPHGSLVPTRGDAVFGTGSNAMAGHVIDTDTFGHQAIIPSWLAKEIKPLLDVKGKLEPDERGGILSVINTLALQGLIEPAIHTKNITSAIIQNTGQIGETMLERNLLSAPLVRSLGAIYMVYKQELDTEQTAKDLLYLARIGAMPNKAMSVTYNRHYALATGAKLEPRYKLSPLLYGPGGYDVRARLLLLRTARAMNPNAPDIQIRDFVNQCGAYNAALYSEWERKMKESGWAPFSTATKTFTLNAIRTFNPIDSKQPTEGLGRGEKFKAWIFEKVFAGAFAAVVTWALAGMKVRGKWPWDDKLSKWGMIPLDKAGTRYFDMMGTFYPATARGSRILGLRAYYDTMMRGGSETQMGEAAFKDWLNAGIHFFGSGPGITAATIALTGQEPQLLSVRDSITGKQNISLRRATPEIADNFAGQRLVNLLGGAATVNPLVRGAAEKGGLLKRPSSGAEETPNATKDLLDTILPESVYSVTKNSQPAEQASARVAKERKLIEDQPRREERKKIEDAIIKRRLKAEPDVTYAGQERIRHSIASDLRRMPLDRLKAMHERIIKADADNAPKASTPGSGSALLRLLQGTK